MLGKFFHKPEAENSDRVPPGQYLAKGFPVLTYGQTPNISTDTWELKVWGLAKPLTFTWSDLMAMPQNHFTADFHCVTRWSKLDVQWTGVKVTDLMGHVEVDPRAVHIMEHCYGGYTTNISVTDFLREENFFAHTLFGEPLPADHGGPVRLVVPHLYAWKSAKWINGLEFLKDEELGFWEKNGYHTRGEPWAEERYSSSGF
ncbi:MAG: sulfite oxidase-like oxidoreductase [Okeania sp. SIO2G4]|uniref:sulfite oxidase-like oxidoreductase n=1 Tax=unclassified Okeania TaxID=2634635 RepID=UPI0013B86A99|nr:MULTISPECIES: sulfite oxidase-like oxidoreductase [unclassified Okeania]NEP42470.1 sulfite oxidase-like oxidoreductase [Okeania sp. SIO2H7]NEP74826.1 sulfite oxidase-like oxidoreductase [Okeania sp. SIO2G5]NEP94296.1 sulfite oxidase-like oxidoreductase [Okeania sp. SIO2F5]NEQ93643.1 sulfite oxidase-like oxidoreductase [Okeania sp. SIO2G4]